MKGPIWRVLLCYVLCVIAIFAFYFAFRVTKIQILPLNENSAKPALYTDAREEGFSTAEFFESDSAIAAKITLNSGMYHPYAGIEFPLSKSLDRLTLEGVDFSEMDSCVIRFRASADVRLILYTADPLISKIGDPLSLRPLQIDVPATRYYSESRLSLSKLEANPIWFDIHGIEIDPFLYLNHVQKVAVETGYATLHGLPTEIEVQKIEFFGPNKPMIRLSIIIFVLVTAFTAWGIFKFYGRKKSGTRNLGKAELKR